MNRYHNIIYKYNMIFKDEQLSKDLNNCNNLPSKWTNWCIDKAKEQWMRRLAWMKNMVYPWNNKNWDYKQFVINRYHPEDALGLKKGGKMKDLIKNIDILSHIGHKKDSTYMVNKNHLDLDWYYNTNDKEIYPVPLPAPTPEAQIPNS